MKLITHHSSLITPPRRGSVIVLVVAVLALLAVIGTVYIVSARSERSAASTASTAVNLDLAQDAVNQKVRDVIGARLYGADGQLAGTAAIGPFGNKAARTWDIPEFGTTSLNATDYNNALPDESWLCSNLYVPTTSLTTDSRYNDASLLSFYAFDPSTGTYHLPYFNVSNPGSRVYTGLGTFHVVADASMLPFSAGTAGDDAFVQLLPFSEANGTRYRFGVRILDTSRFANLNVGMTYNMASPAAWQLNGTYLTGYNLASPSPSVFNPADSFAALNGIGGRVGMWNPVVTGPADYAWQFGVLRFDDLAFFATQPPCPFDVSDELELRSYGNLGTFSTPRPATLWPNTLANRPSPFNTTNIQGNANRGYFTADSWSRDLRPYRDPVDNSGNLLAYQVLPVGGSWLSTLSPPNGPSWVGGSASPYVWPTYPARVAANPDIGSYTALAAANGDQGCADTLTIAAINIASAMFKLNPSLYTEDEARAFVANYLTARWNSWTTDPKVTATTAYTLPNGPSFVDFVGPCLRGGVNSANNGLVTANYKSTLITSATNVVFLGYAAQPFINEVAVQYHYTPAGAGGSWAEQDGAIELFNPYTVPLSLEGFGLLVNGQLVDFSGKGDYVPAGGYFVISEVQGQLDSAIPGTATHTDAGTMAQTMTFQSATAIYLMRKYVDRAGNPQWAAVDQYGVTNIATPPTSNPGSPTTEIDFEARPNVAFDASNPSTKYAYWFASIHDTDPSHTTYAEGKQVGVPSLGVINPTPTPPTGPFVPLYDRTLELYKTYGYNTAYQRQILQNVAELARLMRVCHQIDTTGAPNQLPFNSAPLTAVLPTIYAGAQTNPNLQKTIFPADASIHFDFFAPPSRYGDPTNTTPPVVGDPQAVSLLNCLAFVDRVSDYSLDLGDNASAGGISKLRIPGQINVNTASAEVLATIPALYQNSYLIRLIMAYRWRTNTSDSRIPGWCTSGPVVDFSNANNANQYPGYGIRSLAELQMPLLAAFPAAPQTLYDRDVVWGELYNYLTVRSDTFVVYGYLEAVRQNPRYDPTTHALGFDNSTIWYNNSAAGVSDDPTDKDHPLFRIARKRWVALVDRSQANFGRVLPATTTLDTRFTQPRIIAVKDLPQ